jgi:hypothetical protein
MKKLRFKKGHKNDMCFAVEDTFDGYIICKVFYNVDKCLDYIERTNNERDAQTTSE